jgi:hypothetical protein
MDTSVNNTLTMADRLDLDDAPAWTPHKDDSHDKDLVGVVVSRDIYHGDYGDSIVLVIDRGHPGEKCGPPGRFAKVFAFGATLAGEIERTDPHVGDEIGLRFRGFDKVKVGANAGKPYPLFRAAVARGHGEPDVEASVARDVEHTGKSDIPNDFPEAQKGGNDDVDGIPF